MTKTHLAVALTLPLVAAACGNSSSPTPPATELRSDTPANPKPADYGNLFGEIKMFFDLGIDGIFTDNSDIAKAVRDDE